MRRTFAITGITRYVVADERGLRRFIFTPGRMLERRAATLALKHDFARSISDLDPSNNPLSQRPDSNEVLANHGAAITQGKVTDHV